jgi:hypothetical protein
MRFILSINNVEDLLGHSGRRYGLKDDVVTFRLVDVYDVDDTVIMGNLEGKDLFAELTVELFEFYYYLATVDL